jgi:hypothetical protein
MLLKFKFCIVVIMFVIVSCKGAPQEGQSGLKEFEFSSDICSSIQNATDQRWSESSGVTKSEYYSNLLQQEKTILQYELPRYQQRMNQINSGSGPANGAGGENIDLNSATIKDTDEQQELTPATFDTDNQLPDDQEFAVATGDSANSGGFNLQGGDQVALAKEVCAGCSKLEVESKLLSLTNNSNKIETCSQQDSDEPAVTSASEKALKSDLISLIKGITRPSEFCKWIANWSGGSGAQRNRCIRETTGSFCSIALSAGTSTVTAGVQEKDLGDAAISGATKAIPGAIKSAVIGCAQQMAYNQLKEALKSGQGRQILTETVRNRATAAIKSDKLTAGDKTKRAADIKKAIALAICSAGSKLLANQIDEQPQINYDSPCRSVFHASKSRAKACLNTTASACNIAGGSISLKNFLPDGAIDSNKTTDQLIATSLEMVASAGCQSAGKAGSVLCGTISEAAGQIKKAIMTGNNDWAHCVGTDQAGACAGTVLAEKWLGVKVADIKEPVRTAVPSTEKPGYVEKDVCWCLYSCYQDDWGSNTELHRSNFYTVISNGAAGNRECTNQDGRWNWTNKKSRAGYNVFWKKRACEVIRARSANSEGFGSKGGFEVNYNGRWIYKNMTSGSCPSGI